VKDILVNVGDSFRQASLRLLGFGPKPWQGNFLYDFRRRNAEYRD
jgi:hypothetical protein